MSMDQDTIVGILTASIFIFFVLGIIWLTYLNIKKAEQKQKEKNKQYEEIYHSLSQEARIFVENQFIVLEKNTGTAHILWWILGIGHYFYLERQDMLVIRLLCIIPGCFLVIPFIWALFTTIYEVFNMELLVQEANQKIKNKIIAKALSLYQENSRSLE
jgi:hypothetical protein